VVAFAQFAKRVKRLLWLCRYWVPKTYISQRNQVTITLSQVAKDASNVGYPVSHSYFMSIDKPTVVLKYFYGNSLSELCLRH